MPPPTSYSEQSIAEYIHQELGELPDRLGWSVAAGSYTEIVNSVLLGLDITDLSTWTGSSAIEQLRALACYRGWHQVVKALASKYQFATDFQAFQRQQMQAMALKSLALAERDCQDAGLEVSSWEVLVTSLEDPHDPYAYYPDEFRTR